jgi:hypothetical protein
LGRCSSLKERTWQALIRNTKIELIGTGEQAGTWGTTTNSNFGSATPGTYQGFEQAIGGKADVTMSSTTITL